MHMEFYQNTLGPQTARIIGFLTVAAFVIGMVLVAGAV